MSETPTRIQRSSNYEPLRIFAIFGIITMHAFGHTSVEVHSSSFLFNTGVSIFVLISGYFSTNSTPKKIFTLWFQVFIFSLTSWCITSASSGSYNAQRFLSYLFPVLSNKYWFATSYIVLMVFAPNLNKITESLRKEELKKKQSSLSTLYSASFHP